MIMKKNTIILGFLAFASLTITAQNHFRVMSLNIDRAQENTLDSIGRFIIKFSPDAIALQELDMYPNRPGQDKNYIAELSNVTHMYGIFGLTWKHYLGWDCGNAILSKEPFEKTENFILPQGNPWINHYLL